VDADALPLAGRTIAVTAERRSEEQIRLFEKRGAAVVHAPTMHTVDLTGDRELRTRTQAVIDEPPDWTIATTGFGMRLWFEAAAEWGLDEALGAALGRSQVVARGPKARSACRQRGLDVVWQAPAESMPEVVAWLGAQEGIGDASVVVQLFDPEDHPSTDELRHLAGAVAAVPIYRWKHPEDPGPAIALAGRIADGTVDAVTFTSQPAVRFLLDLAGQAGLADAVVRSFNDGSVLPVCVGPVCAEAGQQAGITTMVWPEPFRLAPMVRLTEEALTRR
jgi:uroporphyrinogen-III synthase